MRKAALAGLVAILAAWTWEGAAAPQLPPDRADLPEAIDKIFQRWDRSNSPGCAVGVSHHGSVVYTKGYGMASVEYRARIRPDTVFEAGSVSKQFTAAAVILLALDGTLSLDDPVRKYVPELPDFGAPILIRHFLTHTSGLRDQWPMLELAGRPLSRAVHTVGEILELVSGYRELNFQPGDEYLYNNTAFTLLTVVVQRVSGQPFDQFCEERLFKPLGMTRTQWRDDFIRADTHAGCQLHGLFSVTSSPQRRGYDRMAPLHRRPRNSRHGSTSMLSCTRGLCSLQTTIAVRGRRSSTNARSERRSEESTRLVPFTSMATSPLPSTKSTSRPAFVRQKCMLCWRPP